MQASNPNSEEVMSMKGNPGVFTVLAVATVMLLGLAGGATGKAGLEVMELIEGLQVGEPVTYKNLTVIPVYSDRLTVKTRYITLDEALAKGYLEITEVGGGSVPQVRMCNRSSECVFVMGGEILTGGRQDRIVGRDVLLAPRSKDVIVPVYCVEQGRWTYESEAFHSKRNLGTAGLRAEGQKAGGDAQSRIWSHVSDIANRAGEGSPTSRFQEAYESETVKRSISGYRDRMERIPRLYPDATGVVIAVGDRITSVDIFANPHMFRQLWGKILRSSALAAACDPAHGTLSQTEAIRFLRMVHDRHYVRKPAVDLGFEVSAIDHEVNANALIYGGGVIHLAAFPEEGSFKGERSPGDSERRIPVMRR